MVLVQGSGYMGDKPDIESFFTQETIEPDEIIQSEIEETYDEQNNTTADIPLPPEAEDENVTFEPVIQQVDSRFADDLAPTNINANNINIVNHAKKPQYVVDVLDFGHRMSKFRKVIRKTSDLQLFAAKAHLFDFYTKDFLRKYKGKPLSKQKLYEQIREVNQDTQLVLGLWLEARDNSKYLPYSAFNGSYQPSVIRAKLNELGAEFDSAISEIKAMNL